MTTTAPRFRHYFVVSSEPQRLRHWKRTEEIQWLVTRTRKGQVHVESVDITLTLDEVYADLNRVEPRPTRRDQCLRCAPRRAILPTLRAYSSIG